MSNAVIGALRVTLGLDSAQFEKGANEAAGKAKMLGDKLKVGLAAASVAASAALVAIGDGVRDALNEADQMGLMAQKIGIPVEELSKLSYAAKLSDVSMGSLQASVKKLSTLMSQAASGNKKAAETLASVGVSAVDAHGKVRPASEVIAQLSDVFSKMPDGAEKTALAMQLFGKSGLEMIPFLNSGRQSIQDLMTEAQQFGLVISGETAEAANNFNDNLDRLSSVVRGISVQLAAALAPALQTITDALIEVAKWFGSLPPGVKNFTVVTAGLTAALAALAIPAGLIVTALAAIGAPVAIAVAAFAGLTAAGIALYQNWDVIKASAASMVESVKASLTTFVDGNKALFNMAVEGVKGFANQIIEVFKALPGQMIEIGGQIIDGLWQGIKAKWDELKTNVTGIAQGIKDSFTGFFDIHSPSRVMAAVGSDVMAGLQNGMAGKSGEVVATAKSAAGSIKSAFDGVDSLGSSVASNLDSAFSSIGSGLAEVIKGTKSWRDVMADVLGQIANSALSNAFGGASSGGVGGFFSSLVSGLTGFASGGTILPGGTGGIDSQVVAFKKSPSEQVDIYKPGQKRGGGGKSDMAVRVYVDQDGNWQAKVEGLIDARAPQHVSAGISKYNEKMPGIISDVMERNG